MAAAPAAEKREMMALLRELHASVNPTGSVRPLSLSSYPRAAVLPGGPVMIASRRQVFVLSPLIPPEVDASAAGAFP